MYDSPAQVIGDFMCLADELRFNKSFRSSFEAFFGEDVLCNFIALSSLMRHHIYFNYNDWRNLPCTWFSKDFFTPKTF